MTQNGAETYIKQDFRPENQRIGGYYGIFCYAVDCVLSEHKRIRRENAGRSGEYVKRLCNSFGYGFTVGVDEAFEKQQEEHKEQGWALVLVTPKEVIEATESWGNKEFRARAAEEIQHSEYLHGYEEGKQFRPEKRIKEA